MADGYLNLTRKHGPDEGKVHDTYDGDDEKGYRVRLVEELQRDVVHGSLVHHYEGPLLRFPVVTAVSGCPGVCHLRLHSCARVDCWILTDCWV